MQESSQKNSDVRLALVKYATNILSARPYFYVQLKNKLIERAEKLSFQNRESEIDSILTNLQKSGYLNDAYLAIGFVKRCLRKEQGPKIIRYKLARLGLKPAQITEALSDPECKEALVEAENKIKSKLSGSEEFKIRHRLYQRGF